MSPTYLLPISGSEESLHASELAWRLAGLSNASVTAQHVVDVRRALAFFQHGKPGLIGSGVYLSAYEELCKSLRDIGEALQQSYLCRVQSQDMEAEFHIDEGDPADQICARSTGHDLVIVGLQRVRPLLYVVAQRMSI